MPLRTDRAQVLRGLAPHRTHRLTFNLSPPAEIGQQMSISVKTVSVYRARVMEKMRLKNNAELTHYAIKNQIVE